jgi:L-iditol 2-dehydrogenase
MKGIMKAAVLKELRKIVIEEREIPIPKAPEVLIKVKHVGICGSDLHYYEHGRIGTQVVQYPMILGHECSGEVVEIGEDVKNLQVGDVVALEPQSTCGKCEFCKTGRYNLCPDVKFLATPPIDGAFADYVTHPADMTFKLPAGMSTVEGALIEPLAIGFHVSNHAEAKIGKNALILGAGCIGLVTLLAMKAMGVTDVYITDLLANRLEKAKELGATRVLKADEVDVVQEILDMTDGAGVDIVVEVAGNRVTTQQTVDLVKRGGRIVLVGYAPDAIAYDFRKLIMKEASIGTSRRYCNIYPLAINAVASGLVPIEKIATHRFNFEDIANAMEESVANKAEITKAVVEFQ